MATLDEATVTVTTSETPVVFYSTETMGVPGKAATITPGTTTTTAPGTSANVTNVGDTTTAIFNFAIPQGSNAASTTTSSMTIPLIGATTTVTVADASWITIGQILYVAGAAGSGLAGDMQVTGKVGNTLTLKNLSASSGAIGGGDMFKAQYDIGNTGTVDVAKVANSVAWANVSGKPLASNAGPGLLGTLSGTSTDFVGGDNACHPFPVPTGTVVDFAGAAAPVGWILCQGQAVSRNTYNALYAVLGGAASPWGQGDGSTTFNLPDFRGRVPVGAGQGTYTGATNRTLGGYGGEETHTLSIAELAAHSHTLGNHNHSMAHTHALPDHTHYCPAVDHTHNVDHYHNWPTQGSHSHGLGGHTHTSGSNIYYDVKGGPSGGPGYQVLYTGASAANLYLNGTSGGPSTGSDAANTPAGSTYTAGTTSGAYANSSGVNGGASAIAFYTYGVNGGPGSTGAPSVGTTGGPSTNTSDSTGSSSGHNNMMPYAVMNRMIKY